MGARIAIAAGGTGGHIYPALATAEALRKIDPACEVRFFSGRRKVEREIYRRAGIEPVEMPVGSWKGGFIGKLATAWQLAKAYAVARSEIRRFKPDALLGMGGYLTYGAILAAARAGVPIVLHEQNAILGRAHKNSLRWAKVVACSYEKTLSQTGATPSCHTGYPVRESIATGDRAAARREFDLPEMGERDVTLLAFGGSQGAAGLNRLLEDAEVGWRESPPVGGTLNVIWATGKSESSATNRTDESSARIRRREFIAEMPLAYALADLVVARAGAGTIAEIAACGLPSILVPLPSSRDDHQRENAAALVESGAATIVEESDGSEAFLGAIRSILEDDARREQMAAAARATGASDAAEKLARLLFEVGQHGDFKKKVF